MPWRRRPESKESVRRGRKSAVRIQEVDVIAEIERSAEFRRDQRQNIKLTAGFDFGLDRMMLGIPFHRDLAVGGRDFAPGGSDPAAGGVEIDLRKSGGGRPDRKSVV